MERLQEENLKVKARGDVSTRWATGMMVGGQLALLATQSLTGWRDILGALWLERMQLELLTLKFKGDESKQRVLARRFGGQSTLLLPGIFSEW